MEHRRLGGSGLFVSEIVYGNWLTHGETVAAEGAAACIRAALDAGIDTFDTADVYATGAAEELLGAALKGQRRDGLVIASKVCLPFGPGPNERGLSRKHIMAACHGSLRRLGTDHLDLYQAHRFDGNTPLEETLIAFDDLVRQGKVRYIGVSCVYRGVGMDGTADPRGPGPRGRADRGEPAAVQHAVARHRARGSAAVPKERDRAGRLPAAGAGRAEREVPAG